MSENGIIASTTDIHHADDHRTNIGPNLKNKRGLTPPHFANVCPGLGANDECRFLFCAKVDLIFAKSSTLLRLSDDGLLRSHRS